MKEQAAPADHAPFDVDLEIAILGSLFRDNALIDQAAEILDAEHFYDPLHARIYDLMLYMQTEGEVTPLTLHAVMKADAGLIEMGGQAYFEELRVAAPALPPIRQFCNILKDLADRRAIIRMAEEVRAAAVQPPHLEKTVDLAEKAQTVLDGVVSGSARARSRRPQRVSDASWSMLRKIERQAVTGHTVGVKTGFPPIDKALGGLMPGKLIVAGGRPGMGKSILGTNWARAAAEDGIPVDYDSAEMGAEELAARFICEIDFDRCAQDGLAPLQYQDFVHMVATGGQIERAAEANIKLQELDIDIFHVPGMTLEWIEANARRRARQRPGHRLLIIDHLQLVELADARRGANRNEVQTEITKRLKALAEELGWTILLLSQLSRAVEERDDKHPVLSDFREGGSIEQDADAVIAVVRPLRYATQKIKAARNDEQRSKAIIEYDDAKGVQEQAVLKNRSGPEIDWFRVFIDEKSSVLRAQPGPTAETGSLLDWNKLAEDMKG